MIPLGISQKNSENIAPNVTNLSRSKNLNPVSSLMPMSGTTPLSEQSLNLNGLPSKNLPPINSELANNMLPPAPLSPSKNLSKNVLHVSSAPSVIPPPSPSRNVLHVSSSPSVMAPPSPSKNVLHVSSSPLVMAPSSPSRTVLSSPPSVIAPPSPRLSNQSLPMSPSRSVVVQTSPSRSVVVQQSPSRSVVVQQSPSRSVVVQQSPSRSVVVQSPSKVVSKTMLPPVPLEENLMKMGNKEQPVYKRRVDAEMAEKPKEPINTGLTKVAQTQTTAVFGNYHGELENQSIEKALLERKFVPIDKILTKDSEGNIMCNFIKVRDNLGRIAFVELDTCDGDMGYISVSSDTPILTVTSDASVVPYSLKVGTYEASKEEIYGIGFECDNTICVMSRKNNSLSPVETVFNYSKGNRKLGKNDVGILDNHPIPYPIVKLSEILKNPQEIEKSIGITYARLREVSFNSCEKELSSLKRLIGELNSEVNRYESISHSASEELSSTIQKLESLNAKYECRGVLCKKDEDKLKQIRFNLQKRNELLADYISLCHSMKDRMNRMAVLRDEIKDLNDYSQKLFYGLNNVFTE